MRKQWGRWLAPLTILIVIAAGCSDDDDDEGADTADETTEEAPAEDAPAEGDAADDGDGPPGSFGCAESIPECEGTITPSEGLTDGATVSITASGFTPGTSLGVTQCADEEDPDHGIEGETTSDDCNLRNISTVTADAEGNVSTEFAVTAGQTFVDNSGGGRTCDATYDCVVSVGELVPDPDAERITFDVAFA